MDVRSTAIIENVWQKAEGHEIGNEEISDIIAVFRTDGRRLVDPIKQRLVASHKSCTQVSEGHEKHGL